MKNISKTLQDAAKELKVDISDLFAIPALDTGMLNLNNGTGKVVRETIENLGYRIVSVKTSDILFTCTRNKKGIKVDFEYGESVRDYRDKPVKAKSDVVTHFRFAGRNFFLRKGFYSFHKDMKDAIMHELKENEDILGGLYNEIKAKIEERIKSGTAFQIDEIVIINTEAEITTHWKRKKAQGIYKMALFAFKLPMCRKYTKLSLKNHKDWYKWAGPLAQDACISVHKRGDNFACAFLTRG